MTTHVLQPIQTRFRGYHFRSRLEARWAVFLDSLDGVQWQYEPQGFDCGPLGWYLPDFWIALTKDRQRPYPRGVPPECGFWLEVKGVEPQFDEDRVNQYGRCRKLAELTGHCVYCAAGPIGEHRALKWHPQGLRRFESDFHCSLDNGECEHIDSLTWYLLVEAWPHYGADKRTLNEAAFDAYQAARSARFEHGETP